MAVNTQDMHVLHLVIALGCQDICSCKQHPGTEALTEATRIMKFRSPS